MRKFVSTIEKSQVDDLEEILSLQKLAFRSEVEVFKDYSIAPFTQSIESIREDFKNHIYFKAVIDGRILGSVRAYEDESVCHIGRLFVHPDFQNRGIGKSLMLHIEEHFKHCAKYSLFAAKRVSKNLHLYSSLGYSVVREETINESLSFVYFVKEIK